MSKQKLEHLQIKLEVIIFDINGLLLDKHYESDNLTKN